MGSLTLSREADSRIAPFVMDAHTPEGRLGYQTDLRHAYEEPYVRVGHKAEVP